MLNIDGFIGIQRPVEIKALHALLQTTMTSAAQCEKDTAAMASIPPDLVNSATPGTLQDKRGGEAFETKLKNARQVVETAKKSLADLAQARAATINDLQSFLGQYRQASNSCKRKEFECKASLEVAKKIKKEIGTHIENIPEVAANEFEGGAEELPEASDLFGDDEDED